MSDTTTLAAEPALARLDWECRHFGLPAAQLCDPDLNDVALAAALGRARREGVELLVWPARGGRDVPGELLEEFAGTLVDRKATFSRSLPPAPAGDDSPPVCQFSMGAYTAKTPSAALYELAISAGIYSRFNVDPRIPAEKFAAMYRRWIERSVAGELADVVLVASLGDHEGAVDERPRGMITLSESSGVGSIGLIAVAAEVRGRGIAAALMHAAHGWMRARGAGEARVVTQLANLPACRLYERCGYRLSRVQHYYHFWPLATSHEP
ncbi:MAG: GNAT family N-acetyltransferase [Pirellulales bacterium]